MSHADEMASLWRDIDAAERIDDPQRRADALESAIRAASASAGRTQDASTLYAIGYAWYMHPRRLFEPWIQEAAEAALQAALELEPEDALTWLYLGHNAYDLGQYDLAKARFERVDARQVSGYLRLKTQEMLLCCDVLLKGLSNSLGRLERFVDFAETLEPVDIWPQQLAKLLASEARRLDTTDFSRLQALAQRLDRAGHFGRWFQESIEKSKQTLDC